MPLSSEPLVKLGPFRTLEAVNGCLDLSPPALKSYLGNLRVIHHLDHLKSQSGSPKDESRLSSDLHHDILDRDIGLLVS